MTPPADTQSTDAASELSSSAFGSGWTAVGKAALSGGGVPWRRRQPEINQVSAALMRDRTGDCASRLLEHGRQKAARQEEARGRQRQRRVWRQEARRAQHERQVRRRESDVMYIERLGYMRADAELALQQGGGDVAAALEFLEANRGYDSAPAVLRRGLDRGLDRVG